MSEGGAGDFLTCKHCEASLSVAAFTEDLKVCSICDYHHVLTAYERLALLTQQADYEILGESLQPKDYLTFVDLKPYTERIADAQAKLDINEAVVAAIGHVGEQRVALALFDFRFIGGSLGAVAGERVILAIQAAIREDIPFVCVTASGGARMQEGVLSLFQMARMSAAVSQLREAGLPFINILTHPTFGGVSASIAMQADIIIAEPGAHIGFTGARVIANAAQQALPQGFQTAEFLRDHGAIDAVVSRKQLSAYLQRTLKKATQNRISRGAKEAAEYA